MEHVVEASLGGAWLCIAHGAACENPRKISGGDMQFLRFYQMFNIRMVCIL